MKAFTPEMTRFNDALRQVMTVSKADLSNRIEADKQSRADKPKRGPKPKSSGHASRDKD
jgi:hypothetical protein